MSKIKEWLFGEPVTRHQLFLEAVEHLEKHVLKHTFLELREVLEFYRRQNYLFLHKGECFCSVCIYARIIDKKTKELINDLKKYIR